VSGVLLKKTLLYLLDGDAEPLMPIDPESTEEGALSLETCSYGQRF
jgi:hypothetical protein